MRKPYHLYISKPASYPYAAVESLYSKHATREEAEGTIKFLARQGIKTILYNYKI